MDQEDNAMMGYLNAFREEVESRIIAFSSRPLEEKISISGLGLFIFSTMNVVLSKWRSQPVITLFTGFSFIVSVSLFVLGIKMKKEKELEALANGEFTLDDRLLSLTGSTSQTKESRPRFGFFQRNGLLFSRSDLVQNDPTVRIMTDLSQFSKLLSLVPDTAIDASVSKLSFKMCVEATHYFLAVAQCIEKHNGALKRLKESNIYRQLFQVPAINRILIWWFSDLVKPSRFIKKFLEGASVKAQEIDSPDKIAALKENKEAFTNVLQKVYASGSDEEKASGVERERHIVRIFSRKIAEEESIINARIAEEERIAKAKIANEERIERERVAAEKAKKEADEKIEIAKSKVQTLLEKYDDKSKELYKTLLEVNDSSSLDHVRTSCNKRLSEISNLELPEDFEGLDEFNQSVEKATTILKLAYAQWHAQRIIKLQEQEIDGQTIAIGAVLGTENCEEYKKKYDSLNLLLGISDEEKPFSRQCKSKNPHFVRALSYIKEKYENEFKGKLKKVILCRTLVTAGSTGQSEPIFVPTTSLRDLTAQREEYSRNLRQWRDFAGPESASGEISECQDIVEEQYISTLKQKLPAYRTACEVISYFEPGRSDADIPLIRGNRCVDAEMWCRNILQILELFQQEEDTPPIASDAIQRAINQLRAQIGVIMTKELQQAKVKAKQPPSFFGKIKEFFKSKEEFLVVHLEFLKELVGAKKIKDLMSCYEQKHTALKAACEAGGNEEMRNELSDLEAAYNNFLRGKTLDSLVQKICGKNNLSILDIDPNYNDDASLIELEAKKNTLLIYIEEEKAYHTKPFRIKTLDDIKGEIIANWQTTLRRRIDGYADACMILNRTEIEASASCLEMIPSQFYKDFLCDSKTDRFSTVTHKYESFLVKLGLKEDPENPTQDFTTLPNDAQKSILKAREILQLAYKEWLADRILYFAGNDRSEILGLEEGATTAQKKKRYFLFHSLLHPDHNRDAPRDFRLHFESADKELSDDLYQVTVRRGFF